MKFHMFFIIFALLFFPFLCAHRLYKNFVRAHVQSMTASEKLRKWNHLLYPYGFQYDPSNDYFFSTRNCWQRKYGYCRFYDEAAPSLNIVADSEPIRFSYGGRRYLIEFWKGQYGLCVGGEVGIYSTDQADIEIPGLFHGPFYDSIPDSEMLSMKIELYRKGIPLAVREGLHWWLTLFLPGYFCKPEDLSMKVCITFAEEEMCSAFIGGLLNAGYAPCDISEACGSVTINFAVPKTEQPASRTALWSRFVLRHNRWYCKIFQFLTRNYPNMLDKLEYLNVMYFPLFQAFLQPFDAGRQPRSYRRIRSFLENKFDGSENIQE